MAKPYQVPREDNMVVVSLNDVLDVSKELAEARKDGEEQQASATNTTLALYVESKLDFH